MVWYGDGVVRYTGDGVGVGRKGFLWDDDSGLVERIFSWRRRGWWCMVVLGLGIKEGVYLYKESVCNSDRIRYVCLVNIWSFYFVISFCIVEITRSFENMYTYTYFPIAYYAYAYYAYTYTYYAYTYYAYTYTYYEHIMFSRMGLIDGRVKVCLRSLFIVLTW